jgi:hypothetical protein
MAMNESLRKRLEALLQESKAADRKDKTGTYPMTLTLNADFIAYGNPTVTAAYDGTAEGELTHLELRPLPGAGYVVAFGVPGGTPGAEPVTRGESGRTSVINMRAALSRFNLKFPETRNLKFPVETDSLTIDGVERPVVLIRVKRPARTKAISRPRKNSGTTAAAEEKKDA